jgi:uncharacterized DUF497 family protein
VALIPEFFPDVKGFQWDEGNFAKNWTTLGVSQTDAEQVLGNRPLVVQGDVGHSDRETRYFAFGRTDGGRLLTIVFTIRGELLRVISARSMSRRERRGYAQATQP